MRYRTFIEITCDAADKDDAFDIAGEYLRGNIESGVLMSSKTVELSKHRTVRYGLSAMVALMFFAAVILNFVPLAADGGPGKGSIRMAGTCTVQPSLKTKDADEFKKEWEKKKDEAVLEYIKN